MGKSMCSIILGNFLSLSDLFLLAEVARNLQLRAIGSPNRENLILKWC